MAKTPPKKNDLSANLGFDAKRWFAAEYKHVALALATLHDMLLPRLVSGELPVRAAERVIKRTTP